MITITDIISLTITITVTILLLLLIIIMIIMILTDGHVEAQYPAPPLRRGTGDDPSRNEARGFFPL